MVFKRLLVKAEGEEFELFRVIHTSGGSYLIFAPETNKRGFRLSTHPEKEGFYMKTSDGKVNTGLITEDDLIDKQMVANEMLKFVVPVKNISRVYVFKKPKIDIMRTRGDTIILDFDLLFDNEEMLMNCFEEYIIEDDSQLKQFSELGDEYEVMYITEEGIGLKAFQNYPEWAVPYSDEFADFLSKRTYLGQVLEKGLS